MLWAVFKLVYDVSSLQQHHLLGRVRPHDVVLPPTLSDLVPSFVAVPTVPARRFLAKYEQMLLPGTQDFYGIA